MKKAYKHISLLLAMLMTVSILSACGDAASGKESSGDTTPSQGETVAETTEQDARIAIPDDLPDKDFEGYEFRILTYSPTAYEVEELTGEIVEDSKYDRQIHINERFNATVKAVTSAGIAELDKELRAAVTAGDDAYDIAIPHQITSGPGFITSHLILDWNDVEYINYEKPWWNQRINETISIMDKQFYIAGYISMPAPFAMLVNKEMITNYNLGDIYGIVKEYKWTLDKMIEMSTAVDEDLDGDGTMSPTADQFGFGLNNDNMTLNFMYSSDILSVIIDDSGKPVPNTFNEKMISLAEKLSAFIHDSGAVVLTGYDAMNLYEDAFREGRMLFRGGGVDTLGSVRDIELEVGLVPYPMWDEEQGYYATHVDAWNGMLCIPKTAEDTSRTGVIVEAMAAYTYKYCIPAYYDVTLGTKYAQDRETTEMLDIVFDSVVYDFGYIFDNWKGCTWTLPRLIQQKKTDVASYWKSVEKSVTKHYDDLYKAILEEE